MENVENILYDGYYRGFIEKTPYMILVADENGLLLHVNEAWKHVLGYPMDDEMDHILWHFVHPYSRSLCQDNFRLAKSGDCFDLEIVFTAYDRSLVYTEGKFNCIYDAVNQIKIVTGIVQDVTVQNQQALEIERIKYDFEEKNKYWDMLQNAYASLINEESRHFDENIINVLRLFGKMVYADRAFILEYNFENQMSTITYEWCSRGVSSKKSHLTYIPFSQMEEWIEAHVTGDYFYVQDVFGMPVESPLRKLLQPQSIKSMIALPMMKNGKCYGCVGFDSVKVHRTETHEEQQILRDLGTLFLYAIRRRKKYLETQEKETRYQVYLNNVPVPIVVCDEKGIIHEANLAACMLSDFSQKELVGRKIKTLFNTDLTFHLNNCFVQGLNVQFTAQLKVKSGEVVPTTVTLTKVNVYEVILMITKTD